jgi:hypothetical protein
LIAAALIVVYIILRILYEMLRTRSSVTPVASSNRTVCSAPRLRIRQVEPPSAVISVVKNPSAIAAYCEAAMGVKKDLRAHSGGAVPQPAGRRARRHTCDSRR